MFLSRLYRVVVASVVALVLSVSHLPGSARAATAAPVTTLAPAISQPSHRMSPAQIITKAKQHDKKGFEKRYKKIKQSKALVSLVKATSPAKKVSKYLQLLTALSTSKQVSSLVSKTKGKYFTVTMKANGSVSVKLIKGNKKAKVINFGPQCWEAWAAWYAWFTGTSALCWGAGAVNPGLGVVCAIALGVISFTLIDFNSACHSSTAMASPAGARRFANE